MPAITEGEDAGMPHSGYMEPDERTLIGTAGVMPQARDNCYEVSPAKRGFAFYFDSVLEGCPIAAIGRQAGCRAVAQAPTLV